MEAIHNERFFYKFIVGDFNARLGMDEGAEYRIERFRLGLRNDSGNRLVGLLFATRLFYGNSIFIEKEECRWTWESPNGTTHAETDTY